MNVRAWMLKAEALARGPAWLEFPQVIQIDTNNYCGPKHCLGEFCSYCYPQREVLLGHRRHLEMPMEQIEWVLRQIGRYGRRMYFVDMFLNGDGLTEPRLPEICALSKKHAPWLPTQTFTCGVLTGNIDYVLTEDLDWLSFTISAHTPALYGKLHGRADNFSRAIRTLKLYLERKSPRQRCEVHCVLTKDNAPYAQEWHDYFSRPEFGGAHLFMSPLVKSPDNLPSIWASGGYTVRQFEEICRRVTKGGGVFWDTSSLPDRKPCNLWDNMSIDVEGYVLQCCNWYDPKRWNYGTVAKAMSEGRSLKELHKEKIINLMENPVCRVCNMKAVDWEKRLEWFR